MATFAIRAEVTQNHLGTKHKKPIEKFVGEDEFTAFPYFTGLGQDKTFDTEESAKRYYDTCGYALKDDIARYGVKKIEIVKIDVESVEDLMTTCE